MTTPNDANEPSPASAGSRWPASAFEAWAARHGLQCRPCGSHYLDSATEWAWLGWQAATLTDAEREAVQTAMNAYGDNNDDRECAMIEATLWGLLERTK